MDPTLSLLHKKFGSEDRFVGRMKGGGGELGVSRVITSRLEDDYTYILTKY